MIEQMERILIVDDDRFALRPYLVALLDAGYDPTTVNGPDEAMEMARSEHFDAVILDIMMEPGEAFNSFETAGGMKTGLALARELQAIQPEAKMIALTLSTDPEVQTWFTRDDSVAFAWKGSVAPPALPRMLRKLLRRGEGGPVTFIVHGHDHESVKELKELLETLYDFPEPIVLSERPSRGRTVIEKFEDYARDVDIVFVLLTPDDVGFASSKPKSRRKRPRMNVVFELGYFLGAMRRRSGHVLALLKGPLELPSDLSGVVYSDITKGVGAAAPMIEREISEWI